jgi:hypothetical protein
MKVNHGRGKFLVRRGEFRLDGAVRDAGKAAAGLIA